MAHSSRRRRSHPWAFGLEHLAQNGCLWWPIVVGATLMLAYAIVSGAVFGGRDGRMSALTTQPRSRRARAAQTRENHAVTPRRVRGAFGAGEWMRLAAFGAAVAALHVAGWALFLWYSSRYRPLVGLGLTAYLFGLRHAFDADHIAAIDNTTRKLLAEGRRPLGIGFFFSLGHAAVVVALAALLAVGTRTAGAPSPRSSTTAAMSARGSRRASCGRSASSTWWCWSTSCASSARCAAASTTASGSRTGCSSGA